MQVMPQPPPYHNVHSRRKLPRQSMHAIQSEKMSLSEAAKLVSKQTKCEGNGGLFC